MKIYTKTGDDGTTGLFGGARVPKASARVEAYGTVDELNAAIGVARATRPDERTEDILAHAQVDLFTMGAELACVPGKEAKLAMLLLRAEDIARLERDIDGLEATLIALQTFILPTGSPQAAALHFARTVCRRAERRVVALGEDAGPQTLRYLNRLSDLLFILARRANESRGDVLWKPGGER